MVSVLLIVCLSCPIISSCVCRYVDDVISRIGRMFPDMTIELFRPNGNSAVLLVSTHDCTACQRNFSVSRKSGWWWCGHWASKLLLLPTRTLAFSQWKRWSPGVGGGSRTNLTSGILYDGNTLSITVGIPFNPLAVLMKRVLDRKV